MPQPLRDELMQIMEYAVSAHPGVQEAFKTGEAVPMPPGEVFGYVFARQSGIMDAILRLADEVEKLRDAL